MRLFLVEYVLVELYDILCFTRVVFFPPSFFPFFRLVQFRFVHDYRDMQCLMTSKRKNIESTNFLFHQMFEVIVATIHTQVHTLNPFIECLSVFFFIQRVHEVGYSLIG